MSRPNKKFKAACQQSDVSTTTQQEAQSAASSAAAATPQPTGAIGNIGTISGSNNPIIVGSHNVHVTYSMEGPVHGEGSAAASQQTDEPWPPAPSAAAATQQPTGAIGNTGPISGSHNPTIVNPRDVHFTYNMKETGGPMPSGSQLSQGPDPKVESRAPSCQDVGKQIRHILKTKYKTTGSYVQLLPRVDDDQKHMAGIYTKVQLETMEGFAEVTDQDRESRGGMAFTTGPQGEIMNSTEYAKIFGLKTRTGELIERLVFYGAGGVGKSTIFDKIAYDWADETSEILNRFKLVFLLKMYALTQESDLVDCIFDQLLGRKSGVEEDELDKFILANQHEVLILLDGFDEMKTKTLDAASFGFVLRALNRKEYQECVICVSTRPSHLRTLKSKSLIQNPSTHVKVLGFSDDDVREYVLKFYEQRPFGGNTLIETIKKSKVLHEFAKIPMLLLLMCLIWRENTKLPETLSRLFSKAVNYMLTRKPDIPKERALTTATDIGQPALCGLVTENQKFSFEENEFEPNALKLALNAGILNKQTIIKNLEPLNNIQFMHKTMQEYCAAKYLQSIHTSNQGFVKQLMHTFVPDGEFKKSLKQLCLTLEGVVSNEYLLRFCCGDSEKCMIDILNLLNRRFHEDLPVSHETHKIDTISRSCFLESQSTKVPSDLRIPSNIVADSSDDFRSLIYLLGIICKSDSPSTHLAGVEHIVIWDMSSAADLSRALGYMKNLRSMRLNKCHSVDGGLVKTVSTGSLRSLSITECKALGGRASEWAPHMKHMTRLEQLQISSSELPGTDIKHIASAVGDMQNLTDLDLSANTALGESVEVWAKELPQMTHLRKLSLCNCNLKPSDIKHIASAVGKMPNLTDLRLGMNRKLGKSAKVWAKELPQMRTLDLSRCNLTSTDITHIAPAVGDMPNLTDLNLDGNTTLAKLAEVWAKELPKMKHLRKLQMKNCNLTPSDMEHIVPAVRDMLTDLDLGGNMGFYKYLCIT